MPQAAPIHDLHGAGTDLAQSGEGAAGGLLRKLVFLQHLCISEELGAQAAILLRVPMSRSRARQLVAGEAPAIALRQEFRAVASNFDTRRGEVEAPGQVQIPGRGRHGKGTEQVQVIGQIHASREGQSLAFATADRLDGPGNRCAELGTLPVEAGKTNCRRGLQWPGAQSLEHRRIAQHRYPRATTRLSVDLKDCLGLPEVQGRACGCAARAHGPAGTVSPHGIKPDIPGQELPRPAELFQAIPEIGGADRLFQIAVQAELPGLTNDQVDGVSRTERHDAGWGSALPRHPAPLCRQGNCAVACRGGIAGRVADACRSHGASGRNLEEPEMGLHVLPAK